MAVYVNILGTWTELEDDTLIEGMVPAQFINDVYLKKNITEPNSFVNIHYNFNNYLIHISQIQVLLSN